MSHTMCSMFRSRTQRIITTPILLVLLLLLLRALMMERVRCHHLLVCGCANDLSYWCLIHKQGRLKGNGWSFLMQLCKFAALAGVPVPSAKEQRNASPVKSVETDSIMLHKMVVVQQRKVGYNYQEIPQTR